MVHGNALCYECHHDHFCGGTTRQGCETMKVDDLKKLIKVGIYSSKLIKQNEFRSSNVVQRSRIICRILGKSTDFQFSKQLYLFQQKTKSDSIQMVFKNAIAEVERNTSAILDAVMNKADLHIGFKSFHDNFL